MITGTKIRIPKEDVEMLREICKVRAAGQHSPLAIFRDIKKFIKKEFKEDLIKDDKATKSKEFGKRNWEDIYLSYERFHMSPTSLKSAFSEKGVSQKFALLPVIVEAYIKRFKHLVPANVIKSVTEKLIKYRFSPEVESRIADMVNSHCSCAYCGEPTKAPVLDKPGEIIVLGRACMIYGPDEYAPRYDNSIKINFQEAENGIWLCLKHAELVSGERWRDFPASQLLEWRNAHHTLVYERVTGIKNITSLGFHLESGGYEAAENLLNQISEQKFLFMDFNSKTPLVFAITDFRNLMESEMHDLKFPLFLAKQVNGIIYICDAYIKIINNPNHFLTVKDGWTIFLKIFGDALQTIAGKYRLQIPKRLDALISKI